MVFAACGITGYALADLEYGPNGGGNIMVSTVGRTIPSGDAMATVALLVTNDKATYRFIRRPQEPSIPTKSPSSSPWLARKTSSRSTAACA